MSQKVKDNKNRWRNKTVAFRMSPEEAAQLDKLVYLSGLSKQEYLIHRVLEKKIVVQGNPRVYKALKTQLEAVYEELKRLETADPDNEELLELIAYIATILVGLKEESNVTK